MKPFIIPVFIPNDGCPNKCIYCDQNLSTGKQSLPTSEEITYIINAHLKSASLNSNSCQYTQCGKLPQPKGLPPKFTNRNFAKKTKFCKLAIQVAFYGGTFTGLPFITQEKYLKTITPYLENKKAHSIRLSTRPDYIDQQNIDLLKSFSVKTIELGVQSMDNEVLKLSQRGYTAQKVEEAASLIKENDLELGIQLMPGLPGDTEEKIMSTSYRVCKIKPDFLRIYPTVVIKNTLLEKLYRKGDYIPLALNQAISLCKKMLLLFQSHSIPVIRMGLQPTETLLKPGTIVAGPFHPAFRELVLSCILYDRMYNFIKENLKSKTFTPLEVSLPLFHTGFTFFVNPSDLSKFLGNKKENIKKLEKEFPGIDIRFHQDERIPKNTFCVDNRILPVIN